jgi:hypothetical protein
VLSSVTIAENGSALSSHQYRSVVMPVCNDRSPAGQPTASRIAPIATSVVIDV